MQRRQLLSMAGLGAAAIAAGKAGEAQETLSSTASTAPVKFKLGCQSGPSTDERFAFFARYGIRNVCAITRVDDPNRLYSTTDELEQLLELGARHGISIDMVDSVLLHSSHIDREANPAIMMADSPQRDRDIEQFQQHIRNCAEVGIPAIKYNMSILGVLRNQQVEGRGGVSYGGWKAEGAEPDAPLTRAGVVDADRFWERIHYFLDRVVPVAGEYRVRIACHPQDPGTPSGYQGVDRVLGTVDGLKQFVAYHDNPYHGLNFCQGTISENLVDPANDIFDVIRYFGNRRKIFNVHLRNIRGHRGDFVETYPDEGDIDLVKAIRVYHEVDYDGMVQPDHVPGLPIGRNVPGNHEDRDQGFAYAYGYIRGLIQSLERTIA